MKKLYLLFPILLLITTLTSIGETYKTFKDPKLGIKLLYPSSWEVTQGTQESVFGYAPSVELKKDDINHLISITIIKVPLSERYRKLPKKAILGIFSTALVNRLRKSLSQNNISIKFHYPQNETLGGEPAETIPFDMTSIKSSINVKGFYTLTVHKDSAYLIIFLTLPSQYNKTYREAKTVLRTLSFI